MDISFSILFEFYFIFSLYFEALLYYLYRSFHAYVIRASKRQRHCWVYFIQYTHQQLCRDVVNTTQIYTVHSSAALQLCSLIVSFPCLSIHCTSQVMSLGAQTTRKLCHLRFIRLYLAIQPLVFDAFTLVWKASVSAFQQAFDHLIWTRTRRATASSFPNIVSLITQQPLTRFGRTVYRSNGISESVPTHF